jgi:hypothetical protein
MTKLTRLSAKFFPASGTATTETYSFSRHIALGGKCTARLTKGSASGDPHIAPFSGASPITYDTPMAQHLFFHQDLNVQQIQSP